MAKPGAKPKKRCENLSPPSTTKRPLKKSDKSKPQPIPGPSSSKPVILRRSERLKVQAQRKFAQGAPVIPIQAPKGSYSSIPSTTQDPIREGTTFSFNKEKTYTEDFLTYLCFKEPNKSKCRPSLPLNYQARLFVPSGVRKQASETPKSAPAPERKTTAASSSQTKVQTRGVRLVKGIKHVKGDKKVRVVYKKVVSVDKGCQTSIAGKKKVINKPKLKKIVRKEGSTKTYITRRRNLPEAKIVGSSTRSGFVRQVVGKNKKPSARKVAPAANTKKDFSSDDDEPLTIVKESSSKSHNTRGKLKVKSEIQKLVNKKEVKVVITELANPESSSRDAKTSKNIDSHKKSETTEQKRKSPRGKVDTLIEIKKSTRIKRQTKKTVKSFQNEGKAATSGGQSLVKKSPRIKKTPVEPSNKSPSRSKQFTESKPGTRKEVKTRKQKAAKSLETPKVLRRVTRLSIAVDNTFNKKDEDIAETKKVLLSKRHLFESEKGSVIKKKRRMSTPASSGVKQRQGYSRRSSVASPHVRGKSPSTHSENSTIIESESRFTGKKRRMSTPASSGVKQRQDRPRRSSVASTHVKGKSPSAHSENSSIIASDRKILGRKRRMSTPASSGVKQKPDRPRRSSVASTHVKGKSPSAHSENSSIIESDRKILGRKRRMSTPASSGVKQKPDRPRRSSVASLHVKSKSSSAHSENSSITEFGVKTTGRKSRVSTPAASTGNKDNRGRPRRSPRHHATGKSPSVHSENSSITHNSVKRKNRSKSGDSDESSFNNNAQLKKRKRTRRSSLHSTTDESETSRKQTNDGVNIRFSSLNTPGVSGICTRTRSGKLKSNDTNPQSGTQKNGDDFTDSDEEPLASKISDTINKSSSTKIINNNITSTCQVANEGASTPNTNTRLSILIDNETREMADRHSGAANTADSIDSSFNVNNGGVHSQTSSSSVDESGNITVQPETEPPIENLRHVMKRTENADNDRAQNNATEGKEDDTLQQSLESYIKNNSDADRNKKFVKTKEYIDKWIVDSAWSSSCTLFLRWLLSTSPGHFAELAARHPHLAARYQAIQNMEELEDEDFDLDNFDIEKMTKEDAPNNKDEPMKEDVSSSKQQSEIIQSPKELIKPAVPEEAVTSIDKVLSSQAVEKPVAKPVASTSGSQEMITVNNKKEEEKTLTETQQQSNVLSGDQSFDVYDFDSGSELSAHNASEELGWKPKGLRDMQRPKRPIPSYTATRRNKMKQNMDKPNQIPAQSLRSCAGVKHSTAQTNNFAAVEPSTSTGEGRNNNPEGHMFFISLDGINKGGATVENMIGGVAVKVGAHEGPDQRVIMTAKLVTKSELNVTRNAAAGDSLVNQAGPVRDIVNSVLPAGFRNTFTPVNVTVAEPTPLLPPPPPQPIQTAPPVFDEMAYMAHALDSAVIAGEIAAGRLNALNSPLRNRINPGMNNNTAFPRVDDPSLMVEAPVFKPTENDFQDPMEYIEKITPIASRFGICKIIPPASFQSECIVWDDMRFTPHNQYVHRMLHRWGPSSRQMCAIKKYLSTQGVTFNQPPKLSGIEIDLPKLYHVVQSLGGLRRVLEKKLWMRVAEEMCIPFNAHYMDSRLDEMYCKYLLPYDTLSNEERQKLFESVDKEWEKRHEKMIARAANPMNCQEEDEDDGRDGAIEVTEDIEECVTRGKSITLGSFARLAKNIISMQFGKTAEPTPDEVETKFWEYVTNRNNHICVNSGSIDSSVWGYGFPSAKVKGNNIAKHPWNLKVLTNNSGSVLRSLGPMVGVTAPTLHVGMAFSACCWYRDPHGLPWIEYLHQGAPKVWYGVPASHGQKFRSALASIVPGLCQQKTIWLLSDTAMVPPSLLTTNGVSLCRTLQQPGEFVIVFPKAFSSSICTGYSVSESVYFALHTWLQTAHQDFTDIRNSCEPSMFSLERLMVAISEDARSSYQVLKQVLPALNKITQQEKQHRETLFNLGLKTSERAQLTLTGKKKMAKRQDEAEECQRCRTNLALSMLYHMTENMAFCLIHGAEYLEANTDQVDKCKLIFMHSIEELQTIMSKLIQRINNLANKKTGKGKKVE